MQKGLQKQVFCSTLNIREIVQKSPWRDKYADLQVFTHLDDSYTLWFLKDVAWKSDFSYLEICAPLLLISQRETLWSDMWTPWWDAPCCRESVWCLCGNPLPHWQPAPVSSCCHRSYSPPSPLQLVCPWQGHQPCLESRKGLPPSFTVHYFWDWNIQMKYFFYIKTQTVIKNLPPTPHILSSVEIEVSCLLSVGGIPKYLPEFAIIPIVLRLPLPLWYLCISVRPVPTRGSICCKIFGKSVNPFVPRLSIWEWERAVQGDLKIPGDSTSLWFSDSTSPYYSKEYFSKFC